LLKKTSKWEWKEEHQRAFEALKKKLVEIEAIGVPRNQGELIMITDSSDIGEERPFSNGKHFVPNKSPHFCTSGYTKMALSSTTIQRLFALCPWGTGIGNGPPQEPNIQHGSKNCCRQFLSWVHRYRFVAHLPIVWFTDNQAFGVLFGQGAPSTQG
jgi:hypothetical protein